MLRNKLSLLRRYADACLIVAAPDLLAVLRAIVADADDRDDLAEIVGESLAVHVRAAIAKADGR